jgi:hypothetical protein
MGSLAEELEKVKVQLRGRKPPPAPGRLVIHREIGPGSSAQKEPPEEMEALRCKDKADK